MEKINIPPPGQLHPALIRWADPPATGYKIRKLRKWIRRLEKKNPAEALNQLNRLDLRLSRRKPRLAIYDHAFHFIGGAQKYGLTIGEALRNDYEITLLANKPVSLDNFREWYGLDLTDCSLKIIPLPFFEGGETLYIDPAKVTRKEGNPFLPVTKESARYDVFINNSMLEMVYPLSSYSVMVCHFPERRPRTYFYSDCYQKVIYNSQYTRHWIEKRWGFTPHAHVYPPVDMEVPKPASPRENLIISVARFDPGGNKKQLDLARAFYRLKETYPEITKNWRLVMIGGTTKNNPYLDRIETYLREKNLRDCEIRVNISEGELKDYYSRARIFWHLCGMGQKDPAKVEHFGMTIGEAMQNRVIPLVFDGGGQREIVENDQDGYRVSSVFELIQHTVQLIRNPRKREELSRQAYRKSRIFTRDRFISRIRSVFEEISAGLSG